jgi:hypothetical protein
MKVYVKIGDQPQKLVAIADSALTMEEAIRLSGVDRFDLAGVIHLPRTGAWLIIAN